MYCPTKQETPNSERMPQKKGHEYKKRNKETRKLPHLWN